MKKIRLNILLLIRIVVLLTAMLPAIKVYALVSTYPTSSYQLPLTLKPSSTSDSIIDVPKYLIAGWWKGLDKEPFDSTTWYRNTAFNVTVRPEMLWDKGRYNHNFFNFGLALIKEYNPSSGFSFGLNFANSDKVDFNFRRFSVEAGYLWNLTNFYYGLDRARRYNIIATTGAEFGKITASDDYKKSFYGGYLGLRLSRTFSPHTTFYIEPRLGIYSDSYDAQENHIGVDAMATAHLGMNYKLSEMLNIVPPKKGIRVLHDNNWFIELGGDVVLPVPKVDYVSAESAYSDRINYGMSVGLGYRVNPLSTGRGRFTYMEDRYTGSKQYLAALNLMLSGTNIFLGENEKRYSDMALVLGPIIQFAKFPDEEKSHLSWGAEAGLQFTRRITPTWELFIEPRFQLIQDYSRDEKTDLHLRKRWDMNVGMVYLYEKREKMRFDEWKPFQNWYIMSQIGVQLPSLTGGDHQLGFFDFSFGRNFGPLYSLRTSVFSGELQSEEPNYDETWNPMFVSYYGVRAEMVANLLRMLAPQLEKSRWNLNISGGMEYGRLTNHYNKTFAIVAGSQLQYRVGDKTWLTAGGRIEQPLKFDAKLPLSAHLGVQYDLKDSKRMDILENYWRWYVQGSIGYHNAFFNNDCLAYNLTSGINITPGQGVRVEFIGSKSNIAADGTRNNWMSISPEYVLNLSNKVLGEDYDRKVDVEFFSGMDFMLHKKKLKVGFNLGTQVNAYLNKSLALFVEPRLSIQPFDDIISPTRHDLLQYHTFIGLRYIHDRFYTVRDENLYRDLFGDKEFLWYDNFKTWIKGWHPFENVHPIRYIKKWHPRQNLRLINQKVRHDDWRPIQKLYFQTTWDAQVATLTNGHQLGAFDFTIGRSVTPLWSIQASIFNGELQSNEPNYDESNNPMFVTYYGGRAELVFNFLRLWSPRVKDGRWNMNVSGGVEMGHLTNHHKKDWAVVATSQLQYRLTSNMWLTAGGRLQKLKSFDAKLPLSGLFGFQYDFKNEKRFDVPANKLRWYIQGGAGFRNAFFNMDNITMNLAAGINITHKHGVRIEYMSAKKNKVNGVYYNWISISPEYVFNMTNKILGEDDKRKVDMELFCGLDLMKHYNGLKDIKVGYNAGTQINANITKSIALFIQPRLSYQPSDKMIAPTGHDKVQVFTNFGIRYSHNRFKSLKEDKKKSEEVELDWNY